MSGFFKRFFKRGQSGQSLVILAIGFIALVGFVGIVTDVSVLFIRYSTLRRAVDAAAVSAASQMRRIADSGLDASGVDTTPLIAEDEADSVASLNLAARSFIELYGLDPQNILVETCRAQQVRRDSAGNPEDESGVDLFNADGTVNSAADQSVVERYRELCTEDELKLVRVTAQIEAPTMFLYLLGYQTVTLTESAISQTAVLDVVLILDVSESMLNETTYTDWEEHGLGYRYLPPVLTYDGYDTDLDGDGDPFNDGTSWDVLLPLTQSQINDRIFDENPNDPANNPVIIDPNLEMPTSYFLKFDSPTNPGQIEPREECQIRAWPRSQSNAPLVPAQLRTEYADYLTSIGSTLDDHFAMTIGQNYRFVPYVPMYNFYGCCNDPDGFVDAQGNYSFDDLVCQPFRIARDAAESFLARLDFKRGDRVAFVTFDRFATLIDPDGPAVDTSSPADGIADIGTQDPMIETERSFTVTGRPDLTRIGAVETLRTVIGVRSESSTYLDLNEDGLWDHFREDEGAGTTTPNGAEDWADWTMLHSGRAIGAIQDQPVAGACPFDNLTLRSPFNLYKFYGDGSPRLPEAAPPLNEILTLPAWFTNTDFNVRIASSYESRASCAGTNIGGALSVASNALYYNGRREGSVWIMVLLSDGAAGASDPMSRVGGGGAARIVAPDPFNTDAITGGLAPIAAPAPDYGYAVFGVCPYGTAGLPGEITNGTRFPYCGDRYPETRTYCGVTPAIPNQQPLDSNNCIAYYDVDDYARDWADWVGLANLTGTGTSGTGRVSEQLLPTIFTIGFGLNFDNGACASFASLSDRYACMRGYIDLSTNTILTTVPTGGTTEARASDYLGEELLRYIGDVGDNFRMDNDYWQASLSTINRIPNAVNPADLTDVDWGGRGPCETETGTRGVWAPLPPQTSCGNYYSAEADPDSLTDVFNEIASRMFTRLSR